MAICRADFWSFITELVTRNLILGIPPLEDGLFANLLIFDYLYYTFCFCWEGKGKRAGKREGQKGREKGREKGKGKREGWCPYTTSKIQDITMQDIGDSCNCRIQEYVLSPQPHGPLSRGQRIYRCVGGPGCRY